jgi:hypothetical protein
MFLCEIPNRPTTKTLGYAVNLDLSAVSAVLARLQAAQSAELVPSLRQAASFNLQEGAANSQEITVTSQRREKN